jgi:ABC-type glycerol-3-phosphate transport system substrate-binding protein
MKGNIMSKILKAILFTVFTVMACSISFAQDALPSGNLIVWMQRANQDQIENTVLPAFLEAYPGITVEFVNYSPQETAQQLAIAIQGGTGAPDVALMESNQVPRLLQLGGLTDLTDLIGDDASDFNAAALSLGEQDGRLFAVPWDTGPVVLYYRRDIFEAAGLPSDPESVDELVATWDQFLEVCQTIKDATALPCFADNRANSYGDQWINLIVSAGLGWYGDDGSLAFESPDHVALLELEGRFWAADLVSNELEWTDNWYASLNEVNLEGGAVPPVATIPIAAWMGGFLKNWAAVDTAGLWGVVRYPAATEGAARSANMGGSSYTIPAQSANQDAAWAFIQFVNSTESQVAILGYGDIFPARISAYSDPIFDEPDPYFADQIVRAIYAESALNMPVVNTNGPFYPLMKATLATAVQRYASGQLSAAEALAEAASVIRSETGMP